jgi:hypothetical protein
MKGLEIAQDFFLNWGMPFLEKEFPELTKRIAAGRWGGSDVLGADDQISQDHNWGPQFTLLLSEDDFREFGDQLSTRMNREAPAEWRGFHVDGAGDQNVLVKCVPDWIRRDTGFSEIPRVDSDWGSIVKDRRYGGFVEARESALYYLKHGAVWLNNNQEFSRWRSVLEYYPENVWYGRLAEESFRLWQYGEYNFVHRIAKRGDPIAIPLCLGQFTEGVMRLQLLLNKDYTPYWKWLVYAFRNLPGVELYVSLLESLHTTHDVSQKVRIVQEICREIHQQMLSMGIVSGKGVHEYAELLLPLVNDHDEFTQKASWMASSG